MLRLQSKSQNRTSTVQDLRNNGCRSCGQQSVAAVPGGITYLLGHAGPKKAGRFNYGPYMEQGPHSNKVFL
jgi:hypothetical protein